MKKKKSKFIIYLEYSTARLGIELAKIIPLRICYALNEVCSRIIFYADKRHRVRALQHLPHAGIVDNKKDAKKIALQSIIHIGKVAIEFVKLHNILTPENMHEYVSYNISDKTKQAMMDARGTICASAHYGNWEITGLSLSILFRPLVGVGRKMDNPLLSNYIFRKRSRYEQKIYFKDNAVKQLLIGLKKQKLLGILTDQHPGDHKGVRTTFFGHPCQSHDTPAVLSLKTGAPLMLVATRRLNDKFRFELIIKGPIKIESTGNKHKDIQLLTQAVNNEFENVVRECPEQWLWSHRRWIDINRNIDD